MKESYTFDIIPKPEIASESDFPMICWKHSFVNTYSENESASFRSKFKKSFALNPAYAVAWGKNVQVKCVSRKASDNFKSNKNLKPDPIMNMNLTEKILSLGWLENKVRF